MVRDCEIDMPLQARVARYRLDGFGNWCSRLVAPPGEIRISADTATHDNGFPDAVDPLAIRHAVGELPSETSVYLRGSRCCEPDRLSETAWSLFGQTALGWSRVQAISDFLHRHIAFGYQCSRATKTALEAFQERTGVCRDFAHLAVTLDSPENRSP